MEDPVASQLDHRMEFECFFEKSLGPLVGQAYVLTGDLQEAQDLAQETLAQAWRHWPRVRGYDNRSAWARRVLHNLAVSRFRRARLQRRHEASTPLTAVPPPGHAHVDLLAALGRLPARQRRAVVLHDVVGLSADEIGIEMNAAPSTVRTWLHRGHKRLAQEVGSDD
ncbi:MAG: sigma-70 family RNA polymerase sigma factor [Acidimicrobiales bacterium]